MAKMSSGEFKKALRGLRLLAFDVDGVLSDGNIYLDGSGRETKQFNTKDGLGIERALKAGLSVALISGRSSEAVSLRARELGISLVFQGVRDKKKALAALLSKLKIGKEEAAFMGDDLPDLELIGSVGVFACPCDAVPAVLARSHHVTGRAGGRGAVREWIDLVLSFRKSV